MDTQKRVWNRVKAPMEPVNSGLVSPLWQDARSRAEFYRQQMKNGSAARQKLFTELYNRETAICRSLAGIQLLRTGKPIRQTQPVAVPVPLSSAQAKTRPLPVRGAAVFLSYMFFQSITSRFFRKYSMPE